MPEDAIVSYDLGDVLGKVNRTDVHDLYAETSYLENFGKRGTYSEVKQSAEYTEVSEDMGPPVHTIGLDGADSGLF